MNLRINLLFAGAMLFLAGCHTPDDLIPSQAGIGITSVSAFFTDADGNILDENHGKFTATVTEGNYDIVIPVSYYYPESSDNEVTQQMLSRMRMKAALDNNVVISPSLLYLDLSGGKKHTFTVTDQRKIEHQYTISVEIVKSAACLEETANILKDQGCVEALNLDGGGSSCMLVNGKETIKPSDGEQRAITSAVILK